MSLRATVGIILSVALVACHPGPSEPGDADRGDAVVSDGVSPGDCTLAPVLNLFATRCTSGGCHGTGGQYPELTPTAVSTWLTQMSRENPHMPFVTPGNPSASWIYLKVSGMQGATGGALMPLGSASPIPEGSLIHDWIMAGAPTHCDTDAGVPPATTPDPNALDQNALFTCAPSHAPGSSVARIRRIDNHEWAHAISSPDGPTWYNSSTYLNPFTNETGAPYSTYSVGVTVDTATLDMYFLNLPDAPLAWDPGGSPRIYPGGYGNSMLRCMFTNAHPADACIDYFVDEFLRVGVLSRTPTADEHSQLRTYLVAAIAREPGGGDTTARKATIDEVGSAAWLTYGALFRTEVGAPVAGDPANRRRLNNDELALAVGSVLNTNRPGSGVVEGMNTVPAPDSTTPSNGWLQQVRAAADDGTIQDPAVIARLIAAYQGGVDVTRADLTEDDLSADHSPRGEYWLAPRIMQFFREWLDYGGADTSFKDSPQATSQYPADSPLYGGYTLSYGNLQSHFHASESRLSQQLDDTIARAVIESIQNHTDVFQALMTTRRFHLPSDLIETNGQACTTNADCNTTIPCTTNAECAASPFNVCDMTHHVCGGFGGCTVIHLCGNSSSGFTAGFDAVYNTQHIQPTQAGRWVDMPADERSGVLTHPAWLAAHGDNFEDDASLVHRGHWIRENLFCQSVPGLELVMVQARLGDHSPTMSARDRVNAATGTEAMATGTQATCIGCHRLMNTLGFPFEIYNHAGFIRTTDHGHMPDGRTVIDNVPDSALNAAFMNAIDFTQRIANSPYAKRCFIRQAFRYFAGRDETMADACTLAAMENALNHGTFIDMLIALVSSDTFLYRTIDGPSP